MFGYEMVNTIKKCLALAEEVNTLIADEKNNSKQIDSIVKDIVSMAYGNKWTTADTAAVILFNDGEFILQNNEITETGIYSLLKVGTYNVIQFRSDTDYSYLEPAYALEFGTKVITETVKRKTVEKIVTDYDSITFTPVKFTPNDCFAAEGRVLTFTRE